jgi:hypothetical protein
LTILALALAACGSNGDGDEDGDEDPGTDLVDATDARVDPDASDPGRDPDADPDRDPDADPPLGPCGVYCMGENRPCPDGALCEYGILDPTFICTDDDCGMCAWIPLECAPDDDPACGCDGVVYANPCERRRAEVQPDPSWISCATPDPAETPDP